MERDASYEDALAAALSEDAAVEEVEARRGALLDLIKARRELGEARGRLAVAKAGLWSAVRGALAVGVSQAEIARMLGWPRQRVHALIRGQDGAARAAG